MKRGPPPHCGHGFSADMEIYPVLQLEALGLSCLTGLALGLVYDVLRPLRRRLGRGPAAVLDVLYALFSCGLAFVAALSSPGGRLGVWELSFILLGFLAYLWLLSDAVFSFTDRCFVFAIGFLRLLKEKLNNILNLTKLFFHNVQK